jgi:hypothetical protein
VDEAKFRIASLLDLQALRLLRAFVRIGDPKRRQELVLRRNWPLHPKIPRLRTEKIASLVSVPKGRSGLTACSAAFVYGLAAARPTLQHIASIIIVSLLKVRQVGRILDRGPW